MESLPFLTRNLKTYLKSEETCILEKIEIANADKKINLNKRYKLLAFSETLL